MTVEKTIRLGTRSSPLAMVQAHIVRDCLENLGYKVNVITIETTGDQEAHRRLADIGGKGLFTKELDQQLCEQTIDIAVHSLKDMETQLYSDIVIGAVLEREDPRDAWISTKAQHFKDLPHDSVVGTASLRRQAQLSTLRPDIKVILLRGNVRTRLNKLAKNDCDGTFLAMAGLNRLGLAEEIKNHAFPLDIESFIPAVGQGVIAISCKKENSILSDLDKINHQETFIAITAERAMLAVLDGTCHTPIGGYAEYKNNQLTMHAMVAHPNGSLQKKSHRAIPLNNINDIKAVIAFGQNFGYNLKAQYDANEWKQIIHFQT